MSLQNRRVSRKRLVRVRRTKGHRRKGGGVSRLRQCKQLTFGLKRNMKKENKTFKGKHKCSKKKLGGKNTIQHKVYEYTSAQAESFNQTIEELKAEQKTLIQNLTVSDEYHRGVTQIFRDTFGAVLRKLTDKSMERVWLIEQTVDGTPSFYIVLCPFVTTYCMQIGIFKTCQQKEKELSSSDVLLPLRSKLQDFVYQTAKSKGFNYVLVCPLKSMYWKLLNEGFTYLELPEDKRQLKWKLRDRWDNIYAQNICTLQETRTQCMKYLNTDVNIILDWIGEPEDEDTYYFYDDWDKDDSVKYLLRDPDKEDSEKTPTQYLRDPDRQIWRAFKKNELVGMLKERILKPENFPDSCRPVSDATDTTVANDDKIVVANIACRMEIFFNTLPVTTPYLGSLASLLVKKIDTDGARTPPKQ